MAGFRAGTFRKVSVGGIVMKYLSATLLVILAPSLHGDLVGADKLATARQFYSVWYKPKDGRYFFRQYYYKPSPTDTSYRYLYLIYKPERTKEWMYWYDPANKVFWARCATVHNSAFKDGAVSCKELWSILPPEKRKGDLSEIKDTDFEKVESSAPFIPDSNDGKRMDCPPIEVPQE